MTKPICATCTPPYHCCAPVGCGQAQCWARGVYGVELQQPQQVLQALPYLTEKGCTVEPHLRPLCSLWLCPEAEPKAPERYWELKAQIMDLEINLGTSKRKENYAENRNES